VFFGEVMERNKFFQLASEGKLHKATGKQLPGEEKAETPLKRGLINGYSLSDICHFYAFRRCFHEEGYKEFMVDLSFENGAKD